MTMEEDFDVGDFLPHTKLRHPRGTATSFESSSLAMSESPKVGHCQVSSMKDMKQSRLRKLCYEQLNAQDQ